MTKKKRIGLILGRGNLAIYCMERLAHLGYEITVARLPCSQVKIISNIDIYYTEMFDKSQLADMEFDHLYQLGFCSIRS